MWSKTIKFFNPYANVLGEEEPKPRVSKIQILAYIALITLVLGVVGVVLCYIFSASVHVCCIPVGFCLFGECLGFWVWPLADKERGS